VTDDARLAIDQLRIADGRWEQALEASSSAPPDAGFAARVRAIADASEQEAAAFRFADSLGLGWRSRSNARQMNLSYELRRGGNRRGASELWERFDEAVAALGAALEGVALSAMARAFSELADVARKLAHDIERVDELPAARRRAG
jgi:hypothetical protein